MFSLIFAWMNNGVNNRQAGDLSRHRAHYYVTVMVQANSKNQSSMLLRGIHRWTEYSLQEGVVIWKAFPCDDATMQYTPWWMKYLSGVYLRVGKAGIFLWRIYWCKKLSWWRHQMDFFRVIGPLCGEFTGQKDQNHYDDVIMGVLASPVSRLFTQPFTQTQIKENIKAPRHWPSCWEFTGTGEFPAQMASNAENVSISWRHHAENMSDVWNQWICCGPSQTWYINFMKLV